jgi:hypothetical protein
MRSDRKGVSLVKGPVAILGAVLIAYGVVALILGNASFRVVNVPNGPITYGERFLGLENNGWTNLLWIAAGGLLLFGSPLHWAAKTVALVVGLVLGAASVISLVTQWSDGNWGVFGIFAANNWTTLAWGAIAVYLLVSALLPRVGGKSTGQSRRAVGAEPPRRVRSEPAHAPQPTPDPVAPPAAAPEASRPVTTGRRVVAPADGDGPEDHGTASGR